jgi:2-hydroxychromene-2-carboxylate isomerase
VSAGAAPEQPLFLYDLASPACYLLAERVMTALPVIPEWEPVLGAAIGVREPEPDRRELERQARAQGLQPLRWPPAWPPDSREAMLAATYAKHIGRGVTFSLACFRQAFAGGRDLGDRDTVLIAGAACEMHPSAVIRALELRSVRAGLERAGRRAAEAGVRSLPAILVGGQRFEGAGAAERAARALRSVA